jgi:hypothetical protein
VSALTDFLIRTEDREEALPLVSIRLPNGAWRVVSTDDVDTNGSLRNRELELGDCTFQVRAVQGEEVIIVPEEEYRVFEIPDSVCDRVGAEKGDRLLAQRTEQKDPSMPYCVVDSLAGPDFGRFRRDRDGEILFESDTTGRVIGGMREEDLLIYSPVALLNRLGGSPDQ